MKVYMFNIRGLWSHGGYILVFAKTVKTARKLCLQEIKNHYEPKLLEKNTDENGELTATHTVYKPCNQPSSHMIYDGDY